MRKNILNKTKSRKLSKKKSTSKKPNKNKKTKKDLKKTGGMLPYLGEKLFGKEEILHNFFYSGVNNSNDPSSSQKNYKLTKKSDMLFLVTNSERRQLVVSCDMCKKMSVINHPSNNLTKFLFIPLNGKIFSENNPTYSYLKIAPETNKNQIIIYSQNEEHLIKIKEEIKKYQISSLINALQEISNKYGNLSFKESNNWTTTLKNEQKMIQEGKHLAYLFKEFFKEIVYCKTGKRFFPTDAMDSTDATGPAGSGTTGLAGSNDSFLEIIGKLNKKLITQAEDLLYKEYNVYVHILPILNELFSSETESTREKTEGGNKRRTSKRNLKKTFHKKKNTQKRKKNRRRV